jgi:phenylacetate-coenzyme A ligase PaaK-like adenylate-forming protein
VKRDLGFARDLAWVLTRSLRVGRGALEALQLRRLRALVRHAYDHVPFYRRHFDQAGFVPEQLRSLADLARVPIIDKYDLLEAGADAFADNVDRGRLYARHTSGTTGTPLAVCRTRAEEKMLSVFAHRRLHLLGARLTDRRAVIKSPEPGMAKRRQPQPLHARLGINPRWGVDATRPREEIVARLRELRPDVISGWSQTIADVASILTDEDRRFIRPRLICPGGEVLSRRARSLISAGFRAPIVDRYAADEIQQMGDECHRGQRYHLIETYGLFEVLNGEHAARPSEGGELVLTGLFSWAMPFIRYRIGDWVTAGGVGCPCGADVLTLQRVDGRSADRFLLSDGRRIHPSTLDPPWLAEVPWLGKYQLQQEAYDRIHVRLAPLGGMTPAPEAVVALERRLASDLSPRFAVRCELVDEIAHRPGGKSRPYLPLTAPSSAPKT